MMHSCYVVSTLGNDYDFWKQYAVVPDFAPTPNHRHRYFGEPVSKYQYRNGSGRLLGYVNRYQKPEGGKITPTLTYAQHLATGSCAWIWKGFQKPRPIYGLELLALEPEKPVLILEGEKTVDAARRQKWFYDYVCIGYPGGHAGWKYTDWNPIQHKVIYLWPDNDAQGKKSFHELANQLKDICKLVKLISLPDGLPDSWDVADEIPTWLNPFKLMEAAA